jgi:hypothetical protein
MPRRRLLLLALLATLLLAAPASAALDGPVYALDPLSHKLKIKPAKLSFRDLETCAGGAGCRRARFVILEWKRKTAAEDGPPPRVMRALGFSCRFGGTDALLRLRCTKGGKLAKATWGG